MLGWSSPAQFKVVNETAYGFEVSGNEFAWIGSIPTLGGVISCLIIGAIMDMFGRKTTMLALIIPFSIGWAMIIWPSSVVLLYIGRFLVGFAGGAFFVVAPAYIGEIATNDIRGTLGSCLQLMITVGILFSYVLGEQLTLKTFNIVCAMLPLFFGAVFVWMPESPYYCVMKNRVQNAEKSLKWLRGHEYNYDDELADIKIDHESSTANRVSLLTVINKTATRRGLMVALILLIFTQLSGVNAVIFYTTDIFAQAKSNLKPTTATIIVGVMQVVATFAASLTVDKLGRRFLLITSATVMTCCNIGLGVYFYLSANNYESLDQLSWLPISSLCIYIIAFSLGLGPIPWVLVGELFSTEAKAIASSLCGSESWLVAFIVTNQFSNVAKSIGKGPTFFGFAGFAAICGIFVFLMVPETKGRSFFEIQRALGDRSNSGQNRADDNNTTVTSVSQNTINI